MGPKTKTPYPLGAEGKRGGGGRGVLAQKYLSGKVQHRGGTRLGRFTPKKPNAMSRLPIIEEGGFGLLIRNVNIKRDKYTKRWDKVPLLLSWCQGSSLHPYHISY